MKSIDEEQKLRLITDWKENDPQYDDVEGYISFLEKNIELPPVELCMFDFKARREVFEPFVGIPGIFTNEMLMELGLDKLHVRVVDNAHVAMADITLDIHGCEQYYLENLEGRIGLDIDKVMKILRDGAREDVFSFECDSEELYIRYENLKRKVGTIAIDTFQIPKMPSITSLGEALTDPKEVLKALKGAEKISDHVSISIANKIFRIYAEGDTDTVDVPIPCATWGGGAGLYSIDYLKNMFNVLSKYRFQKCRVGVGKSRSDPAPLKIYAGCNISSVNSPLSIEMLMAPRIESG